MDELKTPRDIIDDDKYIWSDEIEDLLSGGKHRWLVCWRGCRFACWIDCWRVWRFD